MHLWICTYCTWVIGVRLELKNLVCSKNLGHWSSYKINIHTIYTHSSDSTVNVLCSKDIKLSSESTAKFGFALDGCSEFFSFFNSTVTTSCR